jgi:hypothetical protein
MLWHVDIGVSLDILALWYLEGRGGMELGDIYGADGNRASGSLSLGHYGILASFSRLHKYILSM